MSKMIWPSLGSQCQKCGRRTEMNYIMPVIYHPGGVLARKRYVQKWCVECVGKAQHGTISPGRDNSTGRVADL